MSHVTILFEPVTISFEPMSLSLKAHTHALILGIESADFGIESADNSGEISRFYHQFFSNKCIVVTHTMNYQKENRRGMNSPMGMGHKGHNALSNLSNGHVTLSMLGV